MYMFIHINLNHKLLADAMKELESFYVVELTFALQ